jgi:hypothetical protein
VVVAIFFCLSFAGCPATADFVLQDFFERLATLGATILVDVDDSLCHRIHGIADGVALESVASDTTNFVDH